jgi:hypothetical protein
MDTTLEGGVMTTPRQDADIIGSIARLETKIDGIKEDVSDINKRLYGNGKPGILSDQQTQDSKIETLLKYAETSNDNIKRLDAVAIPNWLSKNWWKVVIALTLIFVVIHSLLPENLTVWQLFQLLK